MSTRAAASETISTDIFKRRLKKSRDDTDGQVNGVPCSLVIVKQFLLIFSRVELGKVETIHMGR